MNSILEAYADPKPSAKPIRALFIAGLYPSICVAVGLLQKDQLIFQKTLARWVMPCGLLMLLGTLLIVFAWQTRQRLIMLCSLVLILFCILTIDPVTAVIVRSLEGNYPEWKPGENEPLEVAIVLGGGTGLTPNMRTQLAHSGDRLALAARLYHQGAVKQLIVTGDPLVEGSHELLSPRAQSLDILTGLSVPKSAIVALPGRTTSEEIASLKAAPELWQGKRCGIITSAIHITRAMELAKEAEIPLVAIPANFEAPSGQLTALSLIPNADNLAALHAVMHEYLGMLVGR